MTTMVCFQCAGVDYCVPVDATRGVRLAVDMVAMPAPSADIAGIITGAIAGQAPLTVVCALGGTGKHIVILETADKTFGVLVDTVAGLRRVTPSQIGPAPDGQHQAFISGTIDDDGQLILVVDPDALSGLL